MIDFLRWLKWWFIETRFCKHERGEFYLIDIGRNKACWCKKCGKLLETLY